MPSPDFWSQVRAQRDAQQPEAPRDRILWVLVRPEQRAEAVIRLIENVGHELRLLHNGQLRQSQVYRDDAELQARAMTVRAELEAAGWKDPGRLEWGR